MTKGLCASADWCGRHLGTAVIPIVPRNISILDSHNCIQNPFWDFFLGGGPYPPFYAETSPGIQHWPFWAILGAEAWVRRLCPTQV